MFVFGEIIRKAREDEKLTQADLANLCGVSKDTVIACERSRYIPSLSTLFAFSKHIKIDLNKLVLQLEEEKNRRKNGKKYPQLLAFLREKGISQRQLSKILGRSNEYLQNRFLSSWINFDTIDVKKTMIYFNLSPETVIKLFVDNINPESYIEDINEKISGEEIQSLLTDFPHKLC